VTGRRHAPAAAQGKIGPLLANDGVDQASIEGGIGFHQRMLNGPAQRCRIVLHPRQKELILFLK